MADVEVRVLPAERSAELLAAAQKLRTLEDKPLQASAAPIVHIVERGLAVDQLLCDDVRNVKVQLEELLQDLTMERCDAVRYVRLAKAKAFYEQLYPETRHGSRRDPKSGSLAFADYASKKTGWGRSSISDWASIGERIAEKSFREMRGTVLGNRHGLLKKLADLAPAEQYRVANMFRAGLQREARNLLARLHEDHQRQAPREDQPATPSIEDPDEVVVQRSREGAECVLRGHILRVHDEGEHVRVRFLGQAARPQVLAAETWIDGTERAVVALRAAGYEVEVSPIEVVIEGDAAFAVAHHVVKLYVTGPPHVAVLIFVARWAATPGPPLYLYSTAGQALRRHDGPVIIVSRGSDDYRGFPLGIGARTNIAADIEYAVVRQVAACAREVQILRGFRAKAHGWFAKPQLAPAPQPS